MRWSLHFASSPQSKLITNFISFIKILLKLGLIYSEGGGGGGGGGGGVLPYITYTGMCRPTGRDFEAPDLERGIHFLGVF